VIVDDETHRLNLKRSAIAIVVVIAVSAFFGYCYP